MNAQIQIANTINQQLRATDPNAVMCWGIHNLKALPETQLDAGYMLGGLQFHVQGYLHRGIVRVWLRADDVYVVQIGYTDRKAPLGMRVKETIGEDHGVFCDNLAFVIDAAVETK